MRSKRYRSRKELNAAAVTRRYFSLAWRYFNEHVVVVPLLIMYKLKGTEDDSEGSFVPRLSTKECIDYCAFAKQLLMIASTMSKRRIWTHNIEVGHQFWVRSWNIVSASPLYRGVKRVATRNRIAQNLAAVKTGRRYLDCHKKLIQERMAVVVERYSPIIFGQKVVEEPFRECVLVILYIIMYQL